jgi:hypothetical protein
MKDLDGILDNWSTLHKHNGILVIVETNCLFLNHTPQSNETYSSLARNGSILYYDSNAVDKVPDMIQRSTSFDLLDAQQWSDPEFAFDGPASPFIIEAWHVSETILWSRQTPTVAKRILGLLGITRAYIHNEIDFDSSSKEAATTLTSTIIGSMYF